MSPNVIDGPLPGGPLTGAETRSGAAAEELDRRQRTQLGQFFTPASVARFIARFLVDLPGGRTVRLLDPGAGIGSLTAAAVEHLVRGKGGQRPHRIDAVTYEVDPLLQPKLRETLAECATWANGRGTELSWEVRDEDYLLSAGTLERHARKRELYDAAIMNPPYRKIRSRSAERRALETLGVRVANLYTAFLAIAADELVPGGVLAAITPRSFANGLYHEPFRHFFFERVGVERLHIFESRGAVFADSGVLQENVIIGARRGAAPRRVCLSVSHGTEDTWSVCDVPVAEVIRPDDSHRFLRIPTGAEDTVIAETMAGLPATLDELGLTVSTGRVVDFRARDYLRHRSSESTAPLIYPGHLRNGVVRWPTAEGTRKPEAIIAVAATERLFLPNETYVLVRRFTAKEERRRVSAAISLPQHLPGDVVAFENHLNVFHRGGRGMREDVARGLAAYLNCSFVDRYVRQFNGHTQINATDLRHLRYPSRERLRALGVAIRAHPDIGQRDLDQLVERALSDDKPTARGLEPAIDVRAA